MKNYFRFPCLTSIFHLSTLKSISFPTAKITSLISHAKSFTLARETIEPLTISKWVRKRLQKDKKNDQNSPSMGKVFAFFLLRLTAKFLAIFPHWLCCVVVVRCQVGGWEDKNVFIFTTLKDGKATKQLKAIMRVVFLWCHRRRRRDISRGVFKEIAFVLWCGWEYFC